jgi:hypothetical protein
MPDARRIEIIVTRRQKTFMSRVHTVMNIGKNTSLRAAKRAAIAAAFALLAAPSFAQSTPHMDCYSEDNNRRIEGCSQLIEQGSASRDELALAHGLRALGYSIKGDFSRALSDYDRSLALVPDSPTVRGRSTNPAARQPVNQTSLAPLRSSPIARNRSIPAPTSTNRSDAKKRHSPITARRCTLVVNAL